MVTRIVGRWPGNIFLHLVLGSRRRQMDNGRIANPVVPTAMKRLFALAVLLLSLLGSAGGVCAQAGWRDLPPEERRQLRQQMREHWQQERSLRRDDERPRWRDLPPEDRRRLREDLREQRAWHEGELRKRRADGRSRRRD